MAEAHLQTETILAGADLSSSQFLGILLDGTVAGAGEAAIGIIQNNPDAVGKETTVAIVGSRSKAVAGAAFAQGVKLMTDANGKFITATATNHVVAYAYEAAGALDEVVAVIVGVPHIL